MTQNAASEKLDSKIYCPCCGARTLQKKKDLSQDTIDYYISCILTGEPFAKEYKLYQGKVVLTVTSVIDSYLHKALEVTALLHKSNLDQSIQQALTFLTHRLLPIKQINIYNQGNKVLITPQASVLQAMDKLINYEEDLNKAVQAYSDTITNPKVCSNIPVMLIQKVVGYHIQLHNSLIQLGLDQSFCASIQQD